MKTLMQTPPPALRLLAFLLMLFGSGCMSSHRVRNTCDVLLYAVTVQSGGRDVNHGYLAPGLTKAYYGPMRVAKSPPPVVSWKMDVNGPWLKQAVEMESRPGLNDDVLFELDGQTVRGHCERRLF